MELYQRILFKIIRPKSRVIDLGCGDGALLDRLVHQKKCSGYGIEQSFDCVTSAIKRGISVYQGDILDGIQQC